MKIKCYDKVVREFQPSDKDYCRRDEGESRCLECGYGFGYHSTKFLKQSWKEHICKNICFNCNKPRINMKIDDGRYFCKNCGYFVGMVRKI